MGTLFYGVQPSKLDFPSVTTPHCIRVSFEKICNNVFLLNLFYFWIVSSACDIFLMTSFHKGRKEERQVG